MHCTVMPGGKNSEISYRVKCILVESERVFGEVIVTQQTRKRLYWVNTCHYPNVSRRRLSNLTKKIFKRPDFMALNSKSINCEPNVEVTAILPSSEKTSELEKKIISIDNADVVDVADGCVELERKQKSYPPPMVLESVSQEVALTSLVDQLLLDIYGCPRSEKGRSESDSTASSYKPPQQHRYLLRARLLRKTKEELEVVWKTLKEHINHAGGLLVRQLRRKNYFTAKRDKQYDIITAHLQAYSAKRSEDTRMRFSLTPQPGESGFTQWLDAMKMVARLQGGIPPEFRKRLWLTMAERHLEQRGVDWKQAEKLCFNEWSNPDDEELGIQIVKDLHRTGCSLFCGAAGRDNQAVLRRVLLGFARWNKSVGYCQGLNVLAAFVLQVTDRAESSAVKVMIYLVEGVLPEGYFADNLRGLSIDMAVFRDLLRMRLPKLSRHLEALQCDAKDKTTGSSYEPPLTNVFTMQWFLTLFCHCLPEEAVLRVWDLIFLEGDEVLLRTALAIWEGISDRIMTVTSADEFYSIMGVLTREMLEFTDVNNLIKTIVNMGPLYGVTDLREKHRYNITPWARRLSEDEDTDTEEEEKLAVAAAMFGVPQRFKKDRSNISSSALQTIGPSSDRERIALDISTLKHQYAKLRERQRQAHIILSAACARQSMVSSTSQAMNHLLVGKSALISAKTRQLGPPLGAIPPKPRLAAHHNSRVQGQRDKQGVTLHWKDTKKLKDTKDEPAVGDVSDAASSIVNKSEEMSNTLPSPKRGSTFDSDSDSTSTELCDEPERFSDVDSEEPTSTSDCYVIATDDEKSPRPGTSPVSGTPVCQSSERHSTSKRDTKTLQVERLSSTVKDSKNHRHREQLDIGEASCSISRITDEIRRLSADDDHNSSPIDTEETAIKQKTNDEENIDRDCFQDFCRSELFKHNTSANKKSSTKKISPVPNEPEGTVQSHNPDFSEKTFELLDSFDCLSSSDKSGINEMPFGNKVPLEDDYRGAVVPEASIAGNNDTAFGPVESFTIAETTELWGSIIRTNNNTTILSPEKSKLEPQSLIAKNFSKYKDESLAVNSSVTDMSGPISNELTFYSRSLAIGHLPIAPATVNEKLNEATEMSLLKDSVELLCKDIRILDSNTRNDVYTSFDATQITESSLLFPATKSTNDNAASTSYEVHKSNDKNLTFFEKTISNNDLRESQVRIEKKIIPNLASGTEIVMAHSIECISTSSGNNTTEEHKVDYAEIDSTSKEQLSPLRDVKGALLDKRKTDLNFMELKFTSSRLSPDYVYHDSLSSKIYKEKTKNLKTPESTKSFSSGETMGPDSKSSSLTTSPRTPNPRSDLKSFVHDKSELSSMSSDSMTLTLQSLNSDVFSNAKKLDRKADITRTFLEKSNPSTPMSSDSLKNKSEISPKFIISSSSESCSSGKVKSSERSFSSELQSPISANSIKYKTNYKEDQDNLSESPMDICSATSPFYPIVYPNQKTPSPYGKRVKQSSNTDSMESSPEQKSTSSKDEATNSTKYKLPVDTSRSSKLSEVEKITKDNDDYDSARPFEKELADTLSTLPGEISRTKNERMSSLYKDDLDLKTYGNDSTVEKYLEEDIQELLTEIDTVSPLPRDKYEKRSSFLEKNGSFKNISINERDHKYSLTTKDNFRPFERSCSSLDKRFGDMKTSLSSEEFSVNTHKKRSSDILEDLRHMEAKTSEDGTTDTSLLTRKTGYDWEDLKNLEARRQDNFSDSASGLSRDRADVPSINMFGESRKSYVVEPRINLDGTDSILKSYARKKNNGEPDDDRESKLGVWTKVKPRAHIRDSGRRSSDRALKIIQENSAILHKILTCQAKKRLPDLEEISKEITISPINEEISKIFSPILEKMGLNEHEINEELARISFKDFDQMTATSGSEFDAKINDELCKLSLIGDNDQLDMDDVISGNYLDTREALIDRQINEELSKLLANYEEASSECIANRDEVSSCQNPSQLEGFEIPSIYTNLFSYQTSNDSIETKSEISPIQNAGIQSGEFPQYSENIMSFTQPSKYSMRGSSPRSDIDIYRELEKLDKISSGEILPSASSQKIISPTSYLPECPSYADVLPSSLEYCIKSEQSFDPSPIKSPYDTYEPYDFKSKISPHKTPSNPYSGRSYDKSGMENFDFHQSVTTPSTLYDLGTSRPILSKETLEFRVRYDDETMKQIRDDDLSLQPYQTNIADLDRGASYYSDDSAICAKRLATEIERPLNHSVISPFNYTYNQPDLYSRQHDPLSPKNYSYVKTPTNNEHKSYKLDNDPEVPPYLSLRRENSHSLSLNHQYADRGFAITIKSYPSDSSQSLKDASKRPVSHPEFVDKIDAAEYTEIASRDSISFRKTSMTLGPLDSTTSRIPGIETIPSPRSLYSPFPVRNVTRKPKDLGLKLGLYSPLGPDSTPLKRP